MTWASRTANIKLSSVATDVLGASGRAMLAALVSGKRDPEQLAQMAKGTLRAKRGQLLDALQGRFTDHHAFLLHAILVAAWQILTKNEPYRDLGPVISTGWPRTG